MRQGLSIIEGGRPLTEVDLDAGDWRIDLRRPHAVEPVEAEAWRALLTRIRWPEPIYADPDYLLTAAVHQSGGRDLVFAFAWSEAGERSRLRGIVPLAMPHGLWGNGRAQAWYPPGPFLAPTIEPDCHDEVEAALRAAIRAVHPRSTLVLMPPAVTVPAKAVAPLSAQANGGGIPEKDRVGVRLAGPWTRSGVEIERITEPRRIRDAVEAYLSFDAQVSGEPIVRDPSASSMVRVVTRRFAQRRQTSVDFARKGGVIVAAALRLGSGPGSIVWRQAEGRAA
ncbi:hypothetical protein [Methylobacterium marchantiae]|uniref:GNAT family N-acetyltransferase n=1 Tax=Methylobacterium marchantiae TaxID=600331 RepID=A0ABW3WYN8_9HYPH|nr:hypothetical protein AIGOOFII_2025 [Methylobacterium marchantiae]